MKILTIVGARPQFIKSASVSSSLKEAGIEEYLVHTGQHYDHSMSGIFFAELGIPRPNINLNVGSGTHAHQTSAMLVGIEDVIQRENPDYLLVYGDTNSTLAGALAASKLGIKIAHIEAGLRSFNRNQPEEINRVIADKLSTFLFCPSDIAVAHLRREGILDGVHQVGDVMHDSVIKFSQLAEEKSTILQTLQLTNKVYALATIHRAENTDNPERLEQIISAFRDISLKVVIPLHPRTRSKISANIQEMIAASGNIKIIEPLGYLDMLQIQKQARLILTDSGGIQKEAFWLRVPCITIRDETEWVETVELGWNYLTGANKKRILDTVDIILSGAVKYHLGEPYGYDASLKITKFFKT
jgi:UDP-GlcNAc3NAcA epimerase